MLEARPGPWKVAPGLQQVYVSRVFLRAADERAALEGRAQSLQAHAAAEELDDLGALALTDVEQSHVRDPPAIPALDELLGSDQDVYSRVGLLDLVEKSPGDGVFLDCYLRCFGLEQPLESVLVADVDEAEVPLRPRHLEPQFPFGAL